MSQNSGEPNNGDDLLSNPFNYEGPNLDNHVMQVIYRFVSIPAGMSLAANTDSQIASVIESEDNVTVRGAISTLRNTGYHVSWQSQRLRDPWQGLQRREIWLPTNANSSMRQQALDALDAEPAIEVFSELRHPLRWTMQQLYARPIDQYLDNEEQTILAEEVESVLMNILEFHREAEAIHEVYCYECEMPQDAFGRAMKRVHYLYKELSNLHLTRLLSKAKIVAPPGPLPESFLDRIPEDLPTCMEFGAVIYDRALQWYLDAIGICWYVLAYLRPFGPQWPNLNSIAIVVNQHLSHIPLSLDIRADLDQDSNLLPLAMEGFEQRVIRPWIELHIRSTGSAESNSQNPAPIGGDSVIPTLTTTENTIQTQPPDDNTPSTPTTTENTSQVQPRDDSTPSTPTTENSSQIRPSDENTLPTPTTIENSGQTRPPDNTRSGDEGGWEFR
jgi:hypothetical protein